MSVDQYQWVYILCFHTKRCICNTNLVKVPRIEESWSPTSATAQHLTVLLFVCFSCATALVLFTAVCQHAHGSHSYLNKITIPECYFKIWFSLWTQVGLRLSLLHVEVSLSQVLVLEGWSTMSSPPGNAVGSAVQFLAHFSWQTISRRFLNILGAHIYEDGSTLEMYCWEKLPGTHLYEDGSTLEVYCWEILTLPQLGIDPDTWLDNVVH